jgi:hypothetical protein
MRFFFFVGEGRQNGKREGGRRKEAKEAEGEGKIIISS